MGNSGFTVVFWGRRHLALGRHTGKVLPGLPQIVWYSTNGQSNV